MPNGIYRECKPRQRSEIFEYATHFEMHHTKSCEDSMEIQKTRMTIQGKLVNDASMRNLFSQATTTTTNRIFRIEK